MAWFSWLTGRRPAPHALELGIGGTDELVRDDDAMVIVRETGHVIPNYDIQASKTLRRGPIISASPRNRARSSSSTTRDIVRTPPTASTRAVLTSSPRVNGSPTARSETESLASALTRMTFVVPADAAPGAAVKTTSSKSKTRKGKTAKLDPLRYSNKLETPRRLLKTPTESHQPPSPRRKGAKPSKCEACGRAFRILKKKAGTKSKKKASKSPKKTVASPAAPLRRSPRKRVKKVRFET